MCMPIKSTMNQETVYITYLGVRVTFGKDDRAFADYPNENDIAQLIEAQVAKNNNTTRELLSDPKRYRVYYPQNSLAQLFTDIEALRSYTEEAYKQKLEREGEKLEGQEKKLEEEKKELEKEVKKLVKKQRELNGEADFLSRKRKEVESI